MTDTRNCLLPLPPELDDEEEELKKKRRTKKRAKPLPPPEPPPEDPIAYQHWLNGIVPLAEGARLRHSTAETLLREHNDPKIKLELVKISKRRWGIRRRTALLLDPPKNPSPGTAPAVIASPKQAIAALIEQGVLVRVAPNLLVELGVGKAE
jgi:hypothetical protein